jgi:CheY-like chemotaxis protein
MKPDGKFILLAEDDPNDVFFFERALSKFGFPAASLRVVNDGEAATAYLSGEGQYASRSEYPLPALVFLDLKMPRKTGMEVLAWLRGQPALTSLPVVVLTSSKHSLDIEEAYRLRANSYLIKPVRLEELVETLKTAITYWLTMNKTPQSVL